MAMMQETDQLYSPFKSIFAQNLKALSDAQIHRDFPTSLPPWIMGLIVFGDTMQFHSLLCQNPPLNLVLARERI